MDEKLMAIPRYKCESYCMCGSRRGHFERVVFGDDGVWIRATDVEQLEAFVTKAIEELRVVEREIGVPSEALKLLIAGSTADRASSSAGEDHGR